MDKPAGWLTTPARHDSDERKCLGVELQKHLKRQIYPVHRLDFEVSGVVLWALNADAHRTAQAWFETSKIKKIYQAISNKGEFPFTVEWREWHSKIAKGKRRAFEAPHGKPSITRARILDEQNGFWKWELMPVTGRPHQLRFEMAKHGVPILGDKLYNPKDDYPYPAQAIALRAVELDFEEIPENEKMGLPDEMKVMDLSWPGN